MRIEEIVQMDVEGDFRSDVQLSDFNNPTLNPELLRNYIFTVHAPATIGAAQRNYSAKDVLDMLKTAFTVERIENRVVLTANYGRGKSHLALTLANFFARPIDSKEKEVETVLNRLQQALNNPSQLAGYRDFKKSKGEFLVVRLQGDAFGDLQEGFIRALEEALADHPSTRKIEIPFWYQHAEQWLKGLGVEARRKAEQFLAKEKTDLPSLTAGLRQQESYQLVRELFKHLNGAYPDFGREISLEELVVWAVDEVCIPKKLGGLLILFDEFSLFLKKYIMSQSAGKLQELLNGVSKRQGKSAFLAFSQQDVDAVAATYAQGHHREDVTKELERLPKDKRASLFSLMEGVLDSYLTQNDAKWESWKNQQPVKGALAQAREIVLEQFSRRYSNDLQWNVGAFDGKVVKGCFPLHPLTTAILSAHDFDSGAGDNPRTALQFVRQTWQEVKNQSAQFKDGSPNFVFPVALVDFFGEQLSKKWYNAYQHAIEIASQALSIPQRRVLQGLYLQQVTGMKARSNEQIDLLFHLCGLAREEIKDALKELRDQKIINYDPISKLASLWPASSRPQELEEIIKKAIQSTPVDSNLMEKITSSLQSLEVSSLNFGHSTDWSPHQVALTSEMFTVDELKKFTQPYRVGANGIEESSRGLIVWLAVQTEEEKLNLRQTAQRILDEALGKNPHPMPVVIVLPQQPVPALLTYARRLQALENMSNAEREKIGTMMYQQELGMAETEFMQALDDLVGDKGRYLDTQRRIIEYSLPGAYRTSVQALKNLSLNSVVTECYRQAYAYRPEFYTQYAVGGKGANKLRESVQKVAHWLFNDDAGASIRNLGNKDIQHNLSNYYLTQQWGLLATEAFTIQRPTARPLQHVWDMLEETFKPGCSDILARPIIINLLNPPYGHDYNTLTLLFAAWIGCRQHEIRIALSGQTITLTQLKGYFEESRGPQDFLNRICSSSPLSISRLRPDETFAAANQVLEQIRKNKTFSTSEAREALAQLEQARNNPRFPENKREEEKKLQPRLEDALQKAQEYDGQVIAWLKRITESDFDELLQSRNDLKNLSVLSLVSASQPSLVELQKNWEIKLKTALDAFCTQYAQLSDSTEYKNHEAQLKRTRKALEQYPVFVKQVDKSLTELSQQFEELKKQEGEKAIVTNIKRTISDAPLNVLYSYRDELNGYKDLSPQTSRLRDEKLNQISNRIEQYEQIGRELPKAVERVSSTADLRQQRDLLLRNMENLKGTRIYEALLETQENINQLEDFFEKERSLEMLSFETPQALDEVEARMAEIESDFSALIGKAQKTLLDKRKQEIKEMRRKRTEEARAWLKDVAQRAKTDHDVEVLLRKMEAPPLFLSTEDFAKIPQIKKILQERLKKDTLLQVETLFLKLDSKARRQLIKHLQSLMDQES